MSRPRTEQERYERNQARVGLASNVLGLTAGVGALGTAVKDPRLKEGGPTARAVHRAGKIVPSPVADRIERLHRTNPKRARKIGAGLALGAVGLQAANTAGDVVANRVLSRESKVKKNAGTVFQSPGAVGRRITDEPDDVGKRLASPTSVGRLAASAPTGLTREQIRMQRYQRKAQAGLTHMRNTTPTERVMAHKTPNRQLRAKAKAVDEARATRQGVDPNALTAGRRGPGGTTPASAAPSSRRLSRRAKVALGVGAAGAGGYGAYELGKADTRERDRGIAIGASGAGAAAGTIGAANQLTTVPMTSRKVGGKGGGSKVKVHGRALAWKDAVERMKTEGKAKPPKISSPRKAALYGAAALGSGAVATHMLRRSNKPEAGAWN